MEHYSRQLKKKKKNYWRMNKDRKPVFRQFFNLPMADMKMTYLGKVKKKTNDCGTCCAKEEKRSEGHLHLFFNVDQLSHV